MTAAELKKAIKTGGKASLKTVVAVRNCSDPYGC
jgi:hypothetical protein